MVTVNDLIVELERIAPPDLAEDGDKIGLQVGERTTVVGRVCVSVDSSVGVIDRAIEREADILVTHHPLIYNPLTSVTPGNPVSESVVKLIRSNTALFAMHTNYDIVPLGVNDVLADMLGVMDTYPMLARRQDTFYKVAVFVPSDQVDDVRDAMSDAGAGRVGQYTHCSFRTPGTGTFVPLPAARPFIGAAGKLEEVEEFKLEMICAGSWVEDVVAAMIEKHPYDQVAYDLIELANEPIVYGLGRVGNLRQQATLREFAEIVRSALSPKYLKVEGDLDRRIKRVALCSGSGSSFFKDALSADADVYVTSDTKHHDILDANASGLAIIDAGHFDTEKPAMLALVDRLVKTFAGSGLEIEYME